MTCAQQLSPAALRRRAAPVQLAMLGGQETQDGWPAEHEENMAMVNVLRAWLCMDPLRDEEEA